jgi:methionyl-tRNA synthetase
LVGKFWPPDVQLIGKDILRVHATIWPVMMMHLGIEFPKLLFVHGHLLSGGRKMSKTIGSVISVDEMLEKFGADGARYLLMSAGTFGEDVDVTMERMIEKYNADLANGIGNLVSRVVKLVGNLQLVISNSDLIQNSKFKIQNYLADIEINQALEDIWGIIRDDDKFIEDNKPWELVKNNKEKFEGVMQKLISNLQLISELLIPFMPETSEKIKKALETKKTEILFPRAK